MAFGREISLCRHQFKASSNNCLYCGIKNTQNQAIKTQGFINPIHVDMKLYFSQMKRRSAKIINAKQIDESTYNLLMSICQKFSFSLETLALGLYLYQNVKQNSSFEKFWASNCLILASKGIQLDKNVPYLNRYQRYADKDHTQQQYQNAERKIFQLMNFDIQYSTFLTFINYYLTSGVIYSNDGLNISLLQYFQDDVMLKAKQYIKKGDFAQYDQQKLGLFIIKQIRKKYNLSQWNKQLQQLTGFKCQQIKIKQDEKVLQPKKCQSNQLINISKTQKIIDLKNICIRKKSDEVSSSKVIFKNSRPNSNTKQNNFIASYSTIQNGSLFNQKPKNNILLAPINNQYLTTKRR